MKIIRFTALLILFFCSKPSKTYSQTNPFPDTIQQSINFKQLINSKLQPNLFASNISGEYNAYSGYRKKQNHKLKVPKVKHSDIISLDLGGTPAPLLFGETMIPIWIQGEYAHPIISDEFYVGGGFLVGSLIGDSKSLFTGIYGNVNMGPSEKNVGFGMGYINYGHTDEIMEQALIFIFSGKTKISHEWDMITDNYFFNTELGLTGIITFRGRKTLKNLGVGLDIGVVIPLGGNVESFLPIPWAGISFPILSD